MPRAPLTCLLADSTGVLLGSAVFVLIAIVIIIRGILAIRNQSIRLRYGIELHGPKAVAYGWFFVIGGIVAIVVAMIVAATGPLLP